MPENDRLQATIILLVLMSLVYGLLAQGAFYSNSFQIIKFAVYLCSIVWMGYWIWTKNLTFIHTTLDSKILLWLLALGITTITSINFKKSVGEIQHYLTYSLVYWLVVNNVKKKDLVNLICATLISMGVILAYVGLVGLVFTIEPFAMQTNGIWRIASTFTYPNAIAGYFVLILPIAYYFSSPSQPQWQQLTFGLAFYVIFLSLILTFSRGAWLSALLISPVILLLHIKSRNHIFRFLLFSLSALATVPFFLTAGPNNYLLPLFAMIGMSTFLICFVCADLGQTNTALRIFKSRTLKLAVLLLPIAIVLISLKYYAIFPRTIISRALSGTGYEQRFMCWRGTFQIIKEHPLLGVGLGNYAEAFKWLNYPYLTKFAHNEYLQAFAETGILGLTTFVLLFYSVFREGFLVVRRQREIGSKRFIISLTLGIAGFCIQSCFDFLWHIPVLFITFFVFAGLINAINQIVSPVY